MNPSIFLGNIRSQFLSDIRVILQSAKIEGTEEYNIDQLSNQLGSLQIFALVNGITDQEWKAMVKDLSPQVYSQLYFGRLSA